MSIDKTKLKPCPFCGGEAYLWSYEKDGPNEYAVCCIDCGGGSAQGNYEAEVVSAWNRRVYASKN